MSKNYYITTTLPYVNAEPHIGFALEIIQADVLARYHRLIDDNVIFNFGTDEHGQKIWQKAREQNKDPKTKIDQISDRGYIDIEHGTLDYAIMFVPNEMLFSFINQQFPEIVDDAMAKKVMIVSPFTFLIVARTVMESYRNFMMENNLRKIVKHISEFSDEWGRFREEFNKMEGTIDKLHDQYEKITSTRYKRMNLRLKRIDEDQRGTKLGDGKEIK